MLFVTLHTHVNLSISSLIFKNIYTQQFYCIFLPHFSVYRFLTKWEWRKKVCAFNLDRIVLTFVSHEIKYKNFYVSYGNSGSYFWDKVLEGWFFLCYTYQGWKRHKGAAELEAKFAFFCRLDECWRIHLRRYYENFSRTQRIFVKMLHKGTFRFDGRIIKGRVDIKKNLNFFRFSSPLCEQSAGLDEDELSAGECWIFCAQIPMEVLRIHRGMCLSGWRLY